MKKIKLPVGLNYNLINIDNNKTISDYLNLFNQNIKYNKSNKMLNRQNYYLIILLIVLYYLFVY